MDEREALSWNERQRGLFEPEAILPVQFFRPRGKETRGGERRLVVAVLEDAINCFQKHLLARDNRGRRLFRDAERWMMSADRAQPFSFENICEFLSLDAEYIRCGLRRWARVAESQAARHLETDSGGARPPAAWPAIGGATRSAAAPGTVRAPVVRPLRSSVGF